MLYRGRSSFSSVFSLFIVFVMTFSIMSWSMCLESKAAENVYYSNHEEPTVGEHSGYINLLVSNFYGDGSPHLVTIFWRINPWKSTDDGLGPNAGTSSMHITVNKSSIQFSPQVYSDYGFATVIEYRPNDTFLLVSQERIDNSASYTDTWPGGTIEAFTVHGNYGTIQSTYLPLDGINTFSVVWADEAAIGNNGNDLLEENNDLQEQGNQLQQESNDLQKEENETSKGILSKVTDFFGSFFDNLVNSVIGVFVPSTEELSSLFDRLNQFFSDTFGFLYYPFDFIIQAFNVFLSSDSSTGLTFPGFSIMGYEVWGDLTYDLGADELAGSIFSYVRIGTGAILSMFFIGYLRNFFEKRFGGGGS